MKRAAFLFCLFTFSFCISRAQDSVFARKVIKELCSKKYHGRGYVMNGDAMAAKYIRRQFSKAGLSPLGDHYFQSFSFPVNRFPGNMSLKINGKTLKPGIDFLVSAGMKNTKGLHEAVFISFEELNNESHFRELCHRFSLEPRLFAGSSPDKWIILDTFNLKRDSLAAKHYKFLSDSCHCYEGIILLKNGKFTWTVATYQEEIPEIEVQRSAFEKNKAGITELVEADIEAQLTSHQTQNVLGYIKGTQKPDSFIVITAHYDHLGMMGKEAMFPGANDNASGIAMLLNLAKYYKKNPPKCSILFIAFAAEEAGLLGSDFYVRQQPIVPLSKMKFLINLDLMGNGADGVMTVNGSIFQKEYELLNAINYDRQYLTRVQSRGKAHNSDHYWFSENGVHCFFFYLMGAYPYYHDVNDTAEAVPLTEFNDAFRLFRDFANALQ